MKLCTEIQRLMREKNITVPELAEAIGASKSCTYQYVDGRAMPSREKLARIEAVLGVNEFYFEGFTRNGEKIEERLFEILKNKSPSQINQIWRNFKALHQNDRVLRKQNAPNRCL